MGSIGLAKQIMEELLKKKSAPKKATEQLAWVQHTNMLTAQVEKFVAVELFYCVKSDNCIVL